jgi:hypothetical protein
LSSDRQPVVVPSATSCHPEAIRCGSLKDLSVSPATNKSHVEKPLVAANKQLDAPIGTKLSSHRQPVVILKRSDEDR